MNKEKKNMKMKDTDLFNDWLNKFEIHQTNEWQKKIFNKDSKDVI